MEVHIEGIGLCGPGLDGWHNARVALAGQYQHAATLVPVCDLLAPNERRRTVPTVKIALAVGKEALEQAGRDASETASVFASSGGDADTVHAILEVLASPMREVSPTRFHNSVHNAPSGYWNIATGSREPTTSLCAFDSSFAAGLLDAAVQATVDNRAVLLVAYEVPYPMPLRVQRPIDTLFGLALVLTPQPASRSFARLDLKLQTREEDETRMDDHLLEALRLGNPAARSLSLLKVLAGTAQRTVVLDYHDDSQLVAAVTPAAA